MWTTLTITLLSKQERRIDLSTTSKNERKKQEFHHNGRLDLYGIPKEKRKILR